MSWLAGLIPALLQWLFSGSVQTTVAHSPDDMARLGLDQKSLTGIPPKLCILLALLCCAADAAGMRIRSIDGAITQWGTCVCVADKIAVTAWHVVDKGAVEVEVAGKWTPAKVLRKDKDNDIASVQLSADAETVEMVEMPAMTVSASAWSCPVQDKAASFVGGNVQYDAKDGNSGAPVMVGQAVVGIVTGIIQDLTGRPLRAYFVGVPAVKALLKAGDK